MSQKNKSWRLKGSGRTSSASSLAPYDIYIYIYTHKCKNHFNEMKGDVGISLHEKNGNKKNLHQADNPSLHLCFKKWFALFGIGSERQDLLQNNCMLLVQEQRNKK